MRVGSHRVLGAVAIAAAAFAAGAIVAPWVERADPSWGPDLRRIYAPLCHQIAGRSLHLADGPLAVCARCTGAYVGGAAGLAAAAWGLAHLRRRKLAWLTFAALPSIVDVGAQLAGYSAAGNLTRALLALPVGVIAGLLLAEGIEDAVRMVHERRRAWSAVPAGEKSR